MLANPVLADLEQILVRGEVQFRELAGERLFITGGTGFFGRWLLESLTWANARLDLGLQLVVLSRDPDAFFRRAPHLGSEPAISWCRGDIRDFDFPPGSFPLIIHAATAASELLNLSQPLEMFDTIVNGTRRVLEFAAKADTSALLLTSSGAVYGPQPDNLDYLDEDYSGAASPNSPGVAYSEGKRCAEFLAANSGLPVKVARGFAFVGPHLPFDVHFAVGNFLSDALLGKAITVRGDGRPMRSYLYAADMVSWLITILLKGAPSRPYNVGSDQAVSIADLARAVADSAGGGEVVIQGQPSSQPAGRYLPSITRARTELGLDVWTPLPVALRRTLDWANNWQTL